MKKLIPLLALALAACGRPHVVTEIQTVHCLTPAQFQKLVQAMPPKVGATLTGQAQKDFKIEEGSNVALRDYGNGLLKVLGGCTGAAA